LMSNRVALQHRLPVHQAEHLNRSRIEAQHLGEQKISKTVPN